MGKDNNSFEREYDSLKDVAEFQNNMYDPGHYVGTGRVPPTVSSPGNALPATVVCFLATALFLAFGLYLLFSDAEVASIGFVESDTANKVIASVIMLTISLLSLLLGFGYLKKTKRYYKQKKALRSADTVESGTGSICQRTCPKCGISHDIDYPKCPNCKHNYLE